MPPLGAQLPLMETQTRNIQQKAITIFLAALILFLWCPCRRVPILVIYSLRTELAQANAGVTPGSLPSLSATIPSCRLGAKMNSTDNSLPERAANYFTQLSSAAKDLNSASDELGQAINAIDTALQKLNLGVPTWVKIRDGVSPHDNMEYWSRDLGYAKVGKKWGIALRTVEGDYNFPEEENVEEWLFCDSPRWLRIEGIPAIPDLLEALVVKTKETTQKIKGKTAEAKNLAAAITEAAGKPSGLRSDEFFAKAMNTLKQAKASK